MNDDYEPAKLKGLENTEAIQERIRASGLQNAGNLSVHSYQYGHCFEFDLEEKARELEELK